MKTAQTLGLSCVLFLCLGGIAAGAQFRNADAPDATGPVTSAEPQHQARIVSSFSEFAGSEVNARSLVTGLRQGREVTLTASGPGGQAGASTQFTPPTRPLSYGDIRISLLLAREQLGQIGISRPTPAEIKAALAGGAVTNQTVARATPVLLPGVLQMRAHGMRWGKIADTMGIKLSEAMSAKAYPSAPPVSAAVRPAARPTTGAVASAAVKVEVPRESRAYGTSPSGSSGSIGAGTVTGAVRPVIAKPAESTKGRSAGAPASAAPISTTARATAGGSTASVPGALTTPPATAAGLPQEMERPVSKEATATEGAVAGAATAAPAQVPVIESIAVTPGTRAEALGAVEQRGPEAGTTAE